MKWGFFVRSNELLVKLGSSQPKWNWIPSLCTIIAVALLLKFTFQKKNGFIYRTLFVSRELIDVNRVLIQPQYLAGITIKELTSSNSSFILNKRSCPVHICDWKYETQKSPKVRRIMLRPSMLISSVNKQIETNKIKEI